MWKAEFWYIDQLSAILHGSRVKIILIYVIMKLEGAEVWIFWLETKFLEACICHIKHTSVLILFMVVAYLLLDYKFIVPKLKKNFALKKDISHQKVVQLQNFKKCATLWCQNGPVRHCFQKLFFTHLKAFLEELTYHVSALFRNCKGVKCNHFALQ